MGRFTDNSKDWELRVGWVCFLAIVFPFVFPPIAMLYMGIRGKIRSLIYGCILWSILYGCIFSAYYTYGHSRIIELSIFLIVLSASLVVAMFLKQFLRRVHLRTYIDLKWGVEYDYMDFMRRKSISDVMNVSDFIGHLMKWQQQIKNNEVRQCILTMLQLTKLITADSVHRTELFLERHAYSIENMLQQYYQIELSNLDHTVIKKAELKLRSTLLVATEAFENELNNKIKYNHLSIEVDHQVYLDELRNKGLL